MTKVTEGEEKNIEMMTERKNQTVFARHCSGLVGFIHIFENENFG